MEEATMKIGRIVLSAAPYAIDQPYDYRIPTELEETLMPGMRVIIPFGAGNRRTEGLVLAVTSVAHTEKKLKPVLVCLDDIPVLDQEGLKLALWIRERWFCTVYDAARAMLPAGLYFSLQDRYVLADGIDRETAYKAAGRSGIAQQIIDLVLAGKNGAELRLIRESLGTSDPNPVLKNLTDQKILVLETSAARGIGDKKEKVAVLAIPPEEAMAQVTPKRRYAPLKYAVTELLCTLGSASVKELCYFTGASNTTLRSLEKNGILTLEQREIFRRPQMEEQAPVEPVVLNQEQEAAFQTLDQLCAAGKPAAALLYGVTGSGKTQVYIKLIQRTLKRGRTALVLVP
ncbi:MAG: primosomal protein N', partial [Oscillospiraceae bacterium]|nr:primosomal protein N' [Oscillospiraceae bacterium]